MGPKHNRVFGQRVFVAVEASGAYAGVAARYGVSVGALRSWRYKLRKEQGGLATSPMLCLLPVTVQAEPTESTFGIPTRCIAAAPTPHFATLYTTPSPALSGTACSMSTVK